jgi:8-oxo-dGTP diphosphatase
MIARWKGEPQPHDAQALAWVRPQELRDYAMPPADVVLVDRLLERVR